MHGAQVRCSISDFQVSADNTKLVLGSGDICLHCFMNNLLKKQSAKFVQNPSSFTKVMAKHILVCFLCPTVYVSVVCQYPDASRLLDTPCLEFSLICLPGSGL